MAARLSPEQVAEVVEALGKASLAEEPCGLQHLVDALRNSKQTAFSSEDVDSVAAAVAALEQPTSERQPWTSNASRGHFFVFEGLDRSGKSTQSKKLAKHLEQAGTVKWMCFPDRSTAVGTIIDLYLQTKIELPDETIHLLFSANRWEVAKAIVDQLNQGTSIVCDRYAFSGVAYSAAKGLDFAWCQAPDRGLPRPDGIFFLHIDEKVGASRSNFGDERYENAQMQSEVRVKFRLPDLRAGVAWHDVDGARDMEVIHAEIRAVAEAITLEGQENHGSRTIGRLWEE